MYSARCRGPDGTPLLRHTAGWCRYRRIQCRAQQESAQGRSARAAFRSFRKKFSIEWMAHQNHRIPLRAGGVWGGPAAGAAAGGLCCVERGVRASPLAGGGGGGAGGGAAGGGGLL